MSIFVFSRRALQDCVDELERTLSHTDRLKLVERLNTPGQSRLPAMWEAIFLRALATTGSLAHETELPNGRRPDFELAIEDSGGRVFVVGDIATVSDRGLDENNPVEMLGNEIARLAQKHGLNPDHFRYDVHGGQTGEYPRTARMSLALGTRKDLSEVIRHHVEPFVRGLIRSGETTGRYRHDSDGIVFTVSYDQAQIFAGAGYLSYTVALSLEKNPIFARLK